MRNFFSAQGHFVSRLEKVKLVFVFLDYDGTLTPIVKRPELAILTARRKSVLKKLSKKSYLKIAIISGRALGDIKRLVAIKDIIFVGNHGMEVCGPHIKFLHKKALRRKQLIADIYKKLLEIAKCFPASFIENKGLTISIHYRLMRKNQAIKKLRQALTEVVNGKKYKRYVRLTEGKKVIEIRPNVAWNKGEAVRWLLRKTGLSPKNILPIYIGDDRTDEDAFFALRNKGISILVSRQKKNSGAKFYLKDVREVYRFLNKLLRIKELSGKRS